MLWVTHFRIILLQLTDFDRFYLSSKFQGKSMDMLGPVGVLYIENPDKLLCAGYKFEVWATENGWLV